jgi:hypothetical protein
VKILGGMGGNREVVTDDDRKGGGFGEGMGMKKGRVKVDEVG